MPDVPLAVARTLYSLDLPAPLRIIRAVGDNVPDVRGRPRDLDGRLDLHVVPLPSGGCLIPLPLVDQSSHVSRPPGAIETSEIAGKVHALSGNPHVVSQYDVACFQQASH